VEYHLNNIPNECGIPAKRTEAVLFLTHRGKYESQEKRSKSEQWMIEAANFQTNADLE
jgi:hypothetical protein